jgi:hypothetical protein
MYTCSYFEDLMCSTDGINVSFNIVRMLIYVRLTCFIL